MAFIVFYVPLYCNSLSAQRGWIGVTLLGFGAGATVIGIVSAIVISRRLGRLLPRYSEPSG